MMKLNLLSVAKGLIMETMVVCYQVNLLAQERTRETRFDKLKKSGFESGYVPVKILESYNQEQAFVKAGTIPNNAKDYYIVTNKQNSL